MIEKKENAIYILTMPTVFKEGEYRFYFFSREETRKHIHVSSANGEAKIQNISPRGFWIFDGEKNILFLLRITQIFILLQFNK